MGYVNAIVKAVRKFHCKVTHLPNIPTFDTGNAILQQLAKINQIIEAQTAILQRIKLRMDVFSNRLDTIYV